MAGEDRQDPGGGRLITATPLPAHACPLCGGPNGCAPAQSGSFDTPCWCRELRVDPQLLAALPPAQRGRACLCRRCIGAGAG